MTVAVPDRTRVARQERRGRALRFQLPCLGADWQSVSGFGIPRNGQKIYWRRLLTRWRARGVSFAISAARTKANHRTAGRKHRRLYRLRPPRDVTGLMDAPAVSQAGWPATQGRGKIWPAHLGDAGKMPSAAA